MEPSEDYTLLAQTASPGRSLSLRALRERVRGRGKEPFDYPAYRLCYGLVCRICACACGKLPGRRLRTTKLGGGSAVFGGSTLGLGGSVNGVFGLLGIAPKPLHVRRLPSLLQPIIEQDLFDSFASGVVEAGLLHGEHSDQAETFAHPHWPDHVAG